MPSLNVVGLISGGKDSLFSLLHCIAHGHKVVALANLHPPAGHAEDMDSFMYQTVGHNIIDLVAQALELPIYRQAINGTAAVTAREYYPVPSSSPATFDEVESMHNLITNVLERHPEVNAISSGAILSDYQRTRVENVAGRLGLVSLAYLWHYPHLPPYKEAALLQEMNMVEQDSRIVKVASGALNDRFLWANVADLDTISKIQKANAKYGSADTGAIIGEGGEYETITLAGPSPLWKHRIHINDQDVEYVNGEAGAASAHIKKAMLSPMLHNSTPDDSPIVKQPQVLDDPFFLTQTELFDTPPRDFLEEEEAGPNKELIQHGQPLVVMHKQKGALNQISNLTGEGLDAADQARSIMEDLRNKHGLDKSRILHATILLRDMSAFQDVNKIYGSYFTEPLPPSRVTISCGSLVPDNVQVTMSFILATNPDVLRRKTGLHVQSRSYWAPANIGPYSQAIGAPLVSSPDSENSSSSSSIHFLAGQIPLIPSTMEIYHDPDSGSDFVLAVYQCLLALQHLWRVSTAVKVDHLLGAVAFISSAAPESSLHYVHAATTVWRKMFAPSSLAAEGEGDDDEEHDESFDVWHQKYGGKQQGLGCAQQRYMQTIRKDSVPPMFVAQVQGLPRDAPVEWTATGWAEHGAKLDVYDVSDGHQGVRTVQGASKTQVAGWMAVPKDQDLEAFIENEPLPADALFTVYTTVPTPAQVLNRLQPQTIPCEHIWALDGDEIATIISYILVPGAI